jgi:hypothetical protein
MPYMLIPVGSNTENLHDYRLYYDMSTGTFVAVDVGGTYPLMALNPDNPQTWYGAAVPKQLAYIGLSPNLTMFVYDGWLVLLPLGAILILVGFVLRRREF